MIRFVLGSLVRCALMLSGNIWSSYNSENNRIGLEEPGDREKGDIVMDITTSFVILIGIFFPSVTGEPVLG